MTNEAIVRTLEKLDLTEAESKVYIQLLKRGSSTAGALAKVSSYSRPKVYEILEKLVNLGLVESFPARPIRFKALDPEIAIPSYLNAKRKELDDVEGELKDSLKRFFNKPESKGSEIFINQGLRKCSLKYCELVKNAEKEIYSFLGWVAGEEIGDLIDAYAVAEKRGVPTKLAYFENETFKDQAQKKDEERLSGVVSTFYPVPSTRFPIKNPPVKFLVVDDHSVQVTLGDYLEDGKLKDVISVHYYNVPAFSNVAKRIVSSYFELLFGGFK
jgi:sugar-specific transcriptional regulator TrmB